MELKNKQDVIIYHFITIFKTNKIKYSSQLEFPTLIHI
jgi:hypothetical protein